LLAYKPGPAAFFTDLGATAVLLDARTGTYFGLDAVATVIWRAIAASPKTADELVDEVVRTFQGAPLDRVSADVSQFLHMLAGRELIDGVTPRGCDAPAGGASRTA
jgi:hypothetical protein